MKTSFSSTTGLLTAGGLLLATLSAFANLPGGGTNGPNVTLTDNGSTVTIANGNVSILCTKSGGSINQINYTYNNGGGTQTLNLLSGGNNGGQLYWENSSSQALTFTYSLIADPANNGGNYAEIALLTTSVANDALEVHYSLLRGATGFYVTAIYFHRSVDGVFGMGECRDNIYGGSIFNWMSVDGTRNRLMEVSGGSAIGVVGAPVECSLWTNGIYSGHYEDKYKYSADFGVQRAWGWSSVGAGGKNVGLWNVSASAEYYNGGPMKRELMDHIGTTILNMINGGHYGMGSDGNFASGEVWTKVCGPYFIYCNNVTNTLTTTNLAAQALYNDALAQAAAEQTAWPYYWFTNANYATAAQRGAVTGQITIADSGNPNASAAGLWVGVVQQPSTPDGIYDFQQWMKPYQFWVKSDTNGNFTIPNVVAGANYTLYAYGPGAEGTFMSQNQTGGNPPLLLNLPANPFSASVAGGATNNLGNVTWTPTRVGATVFEIGYPNRTGDKFRHGDDWWVGDIGPFPAYPLPIWSKFLEYPFDFPSGPNYVVGQSRWTTDWNFCQPIVTDSAGNYNGSTSTITFNLPQAPTNSSQASIYLGISSDYQGPLIVTVNGSNLGSTAGVTAVPNAVPSTGFFLSYGSSDTTIREGINGAFSDERLTFPGSLLHAGQNTITINMRKGGYFANHAMYDYVRLELSGYVPPAPASVTAYPGNNAILICWPVTPGATSYNLLRSTTSGSGYVVLTNGVTGPVCGSGLNNATYLDTTAVNGTTYYYVVQSVNPTGSSTNSPESPGAAPSGSLPTSAPAAPTGLTVSSVSHGTVNLSWNASAGANFYTIQRSTLANTGGGSSNTLSTITLNNTTTGTSYTDTSPTDGSIYSYFVSATSAGGTSGNSSPAIGVPLPAPPATAPGSLAATLSQATNVVLNWSPVSGAVGYVIQRSTSTNGTYLLLASVTETVYTDVGAGSGATYFYRVTAVNAGGISGGTIISTRPAAPASLTAIAGNAQVVLSWPASIGATGYVLKRGTNSGNETLTVASGITATNYTDTGLVNGTTYFYVVAATNASGLGPNSPEASATPNVIIAVGARTLTWRGDGSANLWNVSGAPNWLFTNSTATTFNNGDFATFDNSGSNNVAVNLVGTLQPGLVTFNATKNYTFSGSGSIAGTNALLVTGSGTLTITATNTYSGGTVLSSGKVALSGPAAGGVTANNFALGSGPITFDGGTLQLYGYNLADNSSSYGTLGNALIIPVGQSGTILPAPRYTFAGQVSGAGTLNLFVDYVRGDISGDWTGFTGLLAVRNVSGTPPVSTSDDFRVATTTGFPNARLVLGTNVFMYSRATAGSVIPLGEFSATTNTSVSAGGGTSAGVQNAVTWRVGGLNTDATNAAVFAGTTALIKEGTGSWTLTGASTNTGSTTVSNGTLLVNGSLAGSPVTVWGGTLGGSGSLGAPVNVQSGATLSPGPALGTLTVNNTLTLFAGATTFIELGKSPAPANDALATAGLLTFAGNLIVTNIGNFAFVAGDRFTIFNAPNSAGSFSTVTLPALNGGLAWDISGLYTSGTIAVYSVTPLQAWGDNSFGQSSLMPLTNVAAIAAGGFHNLALLPDGSVIAWGDDFNGQCEVPASVTNVVAIAAGGYHSLAALSDGTVAAWGANDSGQISVPPNATNIVALAGGGAHSLALRGDGTMLAWGDNSWGQTNVPANATNIIAIAAGGQHSLALKADGTVLAWGGDLGPFGDYGGQVDVPWNLNQAVAIAAGGFHSLAVRQDGTVIGWGDNSSGQTSVPATLTNAVAVAAGYVHSLALQANGTVVAWGDNLYGQDNTPSLAATMAIAAGNYHNLVLQGRFPATPSPAAARRTGNTFTLLVPTLRGKPCILFYKNFLTDPAWNFLNLISGNGAQKTMSDPAASSPQRLYRVRIMP